MADKARIVIIGAGTGGTIVANKLNKIVKKRAEITVVDPEFKHIYQPGYLFQIVGRETEDGLIRDGTKLLPKRSKKIRAAVDEVDLEKQVVHTTDGQEIPYDYLIIASGSRLVPQKLEWWNDQIHQFYTPQGAAKVYEQLKDMKEGTIVVSIASMPYKCPPAPLEAALLIDDYLRRKKIRDKFNIVFTSPINRAFSIETVNTIVQPIMENRGIDVRTFFNVDEVDTDDKVLYSLEGEEIDYDLLIMIPPHEAQPFIEKSGIPHEEGGWVIVDRETLKVKDYDNVYAIGDTTNLPISKAGSTAHNQAPIIAKNILASIKSSDKIYKYDGHVQCFFITEIGKSLFVDFNYTRPPYPGKPSRRHWWFKLAFKELYYRFVAKGIV